MEINKEAFEAMIILLYKTNEFEACEKLFLVYKKLYPLDESTRKLNLVKELNGKPYQ